METATLWIVGASALIFFAAALYLRHVRRRSEAVTPPPLLNPRNKRRPRKR